jgi:hypothetical protein
MCSFTALSTWPANWVTQAPSSLSAPH